MKTKAISSIFVLFAIAAGMASMAPAAYADHAEVSIGAVEESGSAFMSGFNELYYSFSPYIADMERENPMFKEAVKLGLTPMLSSLAIMENADSESEVLGLGLSVIALNLGMYIGLPAFGIVKVIQLRRN